MADITKENSLLGAKIETTEGTFAAPASSDYFETLEDGVKITKTRETKSRDLMSGDPLRQDLRLSTKDVEAEVQVELKAGSTEGAAPIFQRILQTFGFKNRGLTSAVVSTTSHTTTQININSGDASKFKVNDIVVIKEAGEYHTSPISAVGSNYITLKIPMAAAPANGVEIAASQCMVIDKTENKTVSMRRVMEGGQVCENLSGMRCNSIQLQNWTTGEMASLVLGMVGLKWEDKLEGSPLSISPTYDNSNPPLILEACIFKGTEKITANEFTLKMERTVAMKKSTCAANGKTASRHTGKVKITGTVNPYKEQDAIDWTLDESEFSLFIRAFNPTATDADGNATEYEEVVAFYLPKCKAVAIEQGDVDGLITDAVSFQLVPESETDSPVIFFS